jgi:CAAX prenyl protease-like protein
LSGQRLTGSDKRTLLIWVLLGIAGVFFARHYFFRAFPEASVNFSVSRDEALQRAQKFINGLGENVSGYQSAIIFDVDDSDKTSHAKTYLERELGLQQANQLMSSTLHIWYWNVRFFKPQQEEEFGVRVTPGGEIVGYTHTVEESRAGATLDRAAAQAAAQSFLANKVGADFSAWDFLPEEINSEKRSNRLDWSFTWEKHGFRAKDAPYRLRVSLQGDRIGSSQEFLRVPDEWERKYKRLRSGNDTLAAAFIVPYILLLAVATWLGISLTRRGQTGWGAALKLGAVVAVVLFFMQLNEWPLSRMEYDTNSPYGSFVFKQFMSALLFGLGSALMVVLVLPAGEPLYRASQPDRLRLRKVLSLRALRSKEFFASAIIGLSMAAAHIGYIVCFYLIAAHYGAWAPQELNYENSVGTNFPWISGAAIGLLASTSEEFTFRLFAIPLLTRITRSRWVAVIVPAFLWSFLHSNYPQEPAYVRGIEIGIIGIVAGIVMLRWGILATLIWHYTVDASLVGLFLLRSNSLYFQLSGVIVGAAAFFPLAYSAISYLRRGGFENSEDLLNRAEPISDLSLEGAPSAADTSVSARRYDALTIGTIGFLIVCLVVGSALTWKLKQPAIGDYLKLSINAKSAQAHADEILRKRGLDPSSFRRATLLVNTTDPLVNEFLRRRVGVDGLNKISATQVPGALWHTRFFRDSQPEEYSVFLKPDGSLYSFQHTLAESAPGTSLAKAEAVARAERYLREEKKIDLRQWTLVDTNSNKLPNRTDHSLVWQQNVPLDSTSGASLDSPDHAFARVELSVLGDEVANYRTFIKIPDGWRRKQEEESLAHTIYRYFPSAAYISLGIVILIVYVKALFAHTAAAITWKRFAMWALLGLFGFLLSLGLGSGLPSVLQQYSTAVPLLLYGGLISVAVVLYSIAVFGGLSLLFGLAWYFASRAFGEERVPGWFGMPANYYRDALWIGLGGGATLLGLNHLSGAYFAHWPMLHRAVEASFGGNFDSLLPAASILGGSLFLGFLKAGIVAVLAGFVAAEVRPRWLRFCLFLLGALALVGGDWTSPVDFARQFLVRVIVLAVLVFGVRRIMRFNLLGCFLVIVGTSLLSGALPLLQQPEAFYRANGYLVLLALVLLFAWPFAAWRVRASTSG